jgi:dihydroneopterin aldolase
MSNISDFAADHLVATPRLDGLAPVSLRPRTRKIVLQGFALDVDIGFHEFEVGNPQRLIITVEVWLDEASFAAADEVDLAWNYDVLRSQVAALATSRRYNLQETLARAIYEQVAARRGVTALRVVTSKPDVYPDCAGVGVELSSFA